MKIHTILITLMTLLGYTIIAHASQEPCTPIKNFGWNLYSTIIDPNRPFFTATQGNPPQITLPQSNNTILNPITAQTSHSIPAAQQVLTKGISLAYANNAHCYQPQGQALFGSTSIATSFNSMVEAIRSTGSYATKTKGTNSKFVSIFRKLQYQILNDLYIYLTALYANFILTIAPIDAKNKNPSAFDLYRSYAKLDATQDLTNKSLIVCHLINLIQGQMYSICSSINPVLPTSLMVRAGSILHENDQSIDPMFLLINLKRPFFNGDDPNSDLHRLLGNIQQRYIQTLGNVLNFFRSYTDVIRTNSNQFLTFARSIRDAINKNPFNIQAQSLKKRYITNVSAKHQEFKKLRQSMNPINPPLLYFDAEMIRSLQVLPTLASALKPSTPVDWPAQIEKLVGVPAQSGSGAPLPFAVATRQDNRLFIQVASPRGVPYMQELIKEPAWLSNQNGVINMIRACLGDFSQLVGLGILEPELEYMIATAFKSTEDTTKRIVITPQVKNGTQRTLNSIYAAQDQYAQDQCKLKEKCCVTASSTSDSAEETCKIAQSYCELAAIQQETCSKYKKDCDAAKSNQELCKQYGNSCSIKNTCTYLKQTCGKKQS